VWPHVRGKIKLDNAALDHWSCESLGRHVGYLPQDVELFDGSIALNICRLDTRATAAAILDAAKAAGALDLILSLPDGFQTRIGDGGMTLSVGQRQRIGLARALFGNPFLVVLDEPTSNLDSAGEAALTQAVMNIRNRGGIAIVVAHRPKAVEAVDLILVVGDGRVQSFGPKDEVLRSVLQPAVPLRLVAERGGGQWRAN
jgi:ATP-binding cassette subfamily C protein